MNTLILGGTRNLGPVLVSELLRGGHGVTVLNRGATPDDLPAEVRRLRADRGDPDALAQALGRDSFDLVVDTTLYNGPDARTIVSLLDGRVGRYVFLSSGQVYLVRGDLPRPFAEEAYEGPVMPPPSNGTHDYEEWRYGAEKRDAEDVLFEAWRVRRFPFTTLRLPMVNSERDHYHRIAGYLARLRDGGPILVPSGPHLALRHVYGGDVARAVMALTGTESGKGRAYNVAQDETVSVDEFLALLAELAGCALRLHRVERATLAEHGLLPECSPFSETWMSELDNRRGKTELGLRYTPLRDYLAALVAYHERSRPPRPDGYRRRDEELRLAATSPAPGNMRHA
ncbi:MAG TPA: NAD-dependent epimerase/dehydratase family protein [Candidatus Eisenbacteria bacterium]|nr:NAD-dependent epimerase/dehydratase family protein [Candidatus Eisenbacteria bacterium]